MVRERPLRYAGCLSDVAHAGRPKPALVHQSQPVGEQPFLVRRTWHVPSMRTFVVLVNARCRAENRQFRSFIIITMILSTGHDSAIRWEQVWGVLQEGFPCSMIYAPS